MISDSFTSSKDPDKTLYGPTSCNPRDSFKASTNDQKRVKITVNPIIMDTDGAIQSVHINGVSVLSRLNFEKM